MAVFEVAPGKTVTLKRRHPRRMTSDGGGVSGHLHDSPGRHSIQMSDSVEPHRRQQPNEYGDYYTKLLGIGPNFPDHHHHHHHRGQGHWPEPEIVVTSLDDDVGDVIADFPTACCDRRFVSGDVTYRRKSEPLRRAGSIGGLPFPISPPDSIQRPSPAADGCRQLLLPPYPLRLQNRVTRDLDPSSTDPALNRDLCRFLLDRKLVAMAQMHGMQQQHPASGSQTLRAPEVPHRRHPDTLWQTKGRSSGYATMLPPSSLEQFVPCPPPPLEDLRLRGNGWGAERCFDAENGVGLFPGGSVEGAEGEGRAPISYGTSFNKCRLVLYKRLADSFVHSFH